MAIRDRWSASLDKDENSVELLRYITPYMQNMDVLVDVSHHQTDLLRARGGVSFLEGGTNPIAFYSMIDTWVGQAPHAFLLQNGTGGSCQSYMNPEPGPNGFSIKADILAWENKQSEHGRVKEVTNVFSPAPFGRTLEIGQVRAFTGKLKKNNATAAFLEFESDADADADSELDSFDVYKCSDVEELKSALARSGGGRQAGVPAWLQQYSLVEKDSSEARIVDRSECGPERDVVEVVDHDQRLMKVRLDKDDLESWEGKDVYVQKKTFAQRNGSSYGGYDNLRDVPLRPAGKVVKLEQDPPRAIVKVTDGCFPEKASANDGHTDLSAWRAMVPNERGAATKTMSLSQMSLGHARISGKSASRIVETLGRKYFFDANEGKDFTSLLEKGAAGEEDTTRVCTLAPVRAQIGARTVDLGAPVAQNERVYAQITTSGHGWEQTDDQCGEFCKVTYRAKFNGKEAPAFTPWRDDCGSNPYHEQQGTWPGSRNGWCPGSVATGHWIDVTDLVKEGGKVKVQFDASVAGHDLYANVHGFVHNDHAMAQTSLNLFRYEVGAPKAKFARSEQPESFIERNARVGKSFVASKSGTFHGATFPWYTYGEQQHSNDEPEFTFPVLSGALHSINSRSIETEAVTIDLDPNKQWHLGLRMRLEGPPQPLQTDPWDRYASLGMIIKGKGGAAGTVLA